MQQLLVDVTSAATILGIGRSKLYQLLTSGKLQKVKIGKRCLIPADALRKFVQDLQAEEDIGEET